MSPTFISQYNAYYDTCHDTSQSVGSSNYFTSNYFTIMKTSNNKKKKHNLKVPII